MLHFKTAFACLTLLILTIACSKEDQEIPADSCKYLGKSYKVSYPSGTGDEHRSEVMLDENGLLKEAMSVYINSFTDVSTNSEYSSSTQERKHKFIYDSEGFLKQQITTISYLAKSKGSIWYGTGFYQDVSEITTETRDFTYVSEKVASISLTSVMLFIGDKNSPVKTTTSSTRTYQYDSGGKPASYTENFDNGDLTVMTYKNGVRAKNVFTPKSGSIHTINYNEMGLVSEDISSITTYKLSYDVKGNLIHLESLVNNLATYKYEFKHYNRPNPETLIPSQFKGIPDPISTIQSSDGKGANNLIEEIFTSFTNSPGSNQKYVHSYHVSGYPETTTINAGPGQGNVSRVTTYKYQDCR